MKPNRPVLITKEESEIIRKALASAVFNNITVTEALQVTAKLNVVYPEQSIDITT